MDISLRTQQLSHLFSYDKKTVLEESGLEIIPFQFSQIIGADEINHFQQYLTPTGFCPLPDNQIQENKTFSYPIFTPHNNLKWDKAIILLHGLNERSWEKYLTWAEYLAKNTGKPVILFPIAFHMNRTPSNWWNPRALLPWVSKRKEEVKDIRNSTFANVALSSRLSTNPLRFYASGRESIYNLWQLTREIKEGEHPLFKENTSVNLFAYSIGALLSQVILLANPEELFSDTKLFMFCGGSIFSQMDGSARDIMDQEAFNRLQNYFKYDFLKERALPEAFKNDFLEKAFKAMIRPDILQEYRKSFFQKACERIRVISLQKDSVMPTIGVKEALGENASKIMLEELDFPFQYSHQIPFPTHTKTDPSLIYQAFGQVFNRAIAFL